MIEREEVAQLRIVLLEELQDTGVMNMSRPGIEKINDIFGRFDYNYKGWFKELQDKKRNDPTLVSYMILSYTLSKFVQDCDPETDGPRWYI